MKAKIDFPVRHISIRVPWHDSGWTGVVCRAPHLNGACARLKRIADNKKEDQERLIAGKRLDELPREQWPCCVDERSTFMAEFELEVLKKHALAEINPDQYGHFKPTPQRYPAYSAGIVPFQWMMRPNINHYGNLYDLDVDEGREPKLGYESNWIHEFRNQRALLEGFAAHLREEESLCLFYAKHVPFAEGTGRVLIAVGRINKIGELIEYNREGHGPPGMVWERPIQHSIRPKGNDGFLMPYYEVLDRAAQDSSLDMERYTARVPEEHWDEFSYASELVTNDGAIGALLSMDAVLARIENELGVATGGQRKWLHDELVRLWKVRGPFPGLGAVLTSFGMSRGLFVAHAIQQKAGKNADPWPLVDRAFCEPSSVLPKELQRDLKELCPTWKGLSEERRDFLRLISRFEITVEQAENLYDEDSRKRAGWGGTDREILQNPYRIFELSRHDFEGVKLLTVDRGVFPDDTVRLLHPLEEPSRLCSAVDWRRIRAFAVAALEDAALNGHTLLPRDKVVEAIRSYPIKPECPVTSDILTANSKNMTPEIVPVELDGESGFQLERYKKIGDEVRRQVLGRLAGGRHVVKGDWKALLDEKFGIAKDDEEKRAREEKAAALAELAEARFGVLVGSAGTGKTSLLGILCAQPEIKKDGVLLLAPTGKARVRMQELVGAGAKAMTIAQFLNQWSRYDGRNGRYHVSDGPKASGYGTVIVDESSMLTEDMLGAIFDALQGVKRFIFVGDPSQLPPIGAGKPFVDIIAKIRPSDCERRFPRVGPGYAELTIERRQGGQDRPDLRLARWFSLSPPSAGDDDVFFDDAKEHPTIRFIEWKKPEDFQTKLLEVLVQELKLSGIEDIRGFNKAMGATVTEKYDYFNPTRNGKVSAVQAVDAWQILSPLRGMPFGVGDINRQIHERFRAGFLELASRHRRHIPKPFGAERIVYGDKVINLSNHRRDGKKVYPQEGAIGYLANGEIGIVVGLWKTNGNPKILKVEFSSQPGFTYDFYSNDFEEEGDPVLELAYALTVHKAQGSQFRLVILVLPEGHPIMSRELVYTALTRHQDRIVVMHQGPLTILKELSAPHRSETARRMTNLMQPCKMLEFPQARGSLFLQEGLIHRTRKGLAVRSRAEVIIADALTDANVSFEYEKPLMLGGSTRYPDFTIEDEISGRTYYWEHLGLLHRADYRRSWNEKLKWYRDHGIKPREEGGGVNGTLIITRDNADGGIDSQSIAKIIKEVFGG
ncbi:MAG: AAA family ATPase [Candidatus Saccharicenans sp.]|jgi:ATP-dependent exoDNAse (exonuclease V) alpha subunit|nr:AAA family ATPase [Candidatus Saccharicenans sp.]MDH7574241.1 AAA family ATPase [Candidatus Saccharicenans sp.]